MIFTSPRFSTDSNLIALRNVTEPRDRRAIRANISGIDSGPYGKGLCVDLFTFSLQSLSYYCSAE